MITSQVQTRYRTLYARMSHRTEASKKCLYITDHRKLNNTSMSVRNDSSYLRAKVTRCNRFQEFKCIQFNPRYETVAICKRLTRIILIYIIYTTSMLVYIYNCVILCTSILHICTYISTYMNKSIDNTFKTVYHMCCAILFDNIMYVQIAI